MEIKEMRLFLSMAEEKNLTRAAEKHGYTCLLYTSRCV